MIEYDMTKIMPGLTFYLVRDVLCPSAGTVQTLSLPAILSSTCPSGYYATFSVQSSAVDLIGERQKEKSLNDSSRVRFQNACHQSQKWAASQLKLTPENGRDASRPPA